MEHRLLWFRDDLRVNDNAAVSAALDCDPSTQITAVFLSADAEWTSFGYGENRLYYTEQLLKSLAQELARLGIRLQVVRLPDYENQAHWVIEFQSEQFTFELFALHF